MAVQKQEQQGETMRIVPYEIGGRWRVGFEADGGPVDINNLRFPMHWHFFVWDWSDEAAQEIARLFPAHL